MIRVIFVLVALCATTAHAETQRTIAGSLQLDYLAVPTMKRASPDTFDAGTLELSLKMSVDFTHSASATVKACFACHGFEAAAAFVDLRAADELSVRVGRFTPSFGSFPQRYDPANHRTSDKPLPYDMGRMLFRADWNEGILPAPWVDNGIEVGGTHFFDNGRVDYATYALSGPKADPDPIDFNFAESHSPYYVDNNSEPIVGARVAGSVDLDEHNTLDAGASAMAGHYDPAGKLAFEIGGVDAAAHLEPVILRAEFLYRRTEVSLVDADMKLQPGPGGRFDNAFTKYGYDVEAEIPLGAVDLIGRFDGLHRTGNASLGSSLAYESSVQRYTAALAVRVSSNIRLKTSFEYWVFRPMGNWPAIHVGIATPF